MVCCERWVYERKNHHDHAEKLHVPRWRLLRRPRLISQALVHLHPRSPASLAVMAALVCMGLLAATLLQPHRWKCGFAPVCPQGLEHRDLMMQLDVARSEKSRYSTSLDQEGCLRLRQKRRVVSMIVGSCSFTESRADFLFYLTVYGGIRCPRKYACDHRRAS
jgi:hypothetical protein